MFIYIYICIYALYHTKYDKIDIKKNLNKGKVLYIKILKIFIVKSTISLVQRRIQKMKRFYEEDLYIRYSKLYEIPQNKGTMCIYVCIYALYRKKYDSIDVKKNSNNEKVLCTKNLKICIYDTPNYLRYHKIKKLWRSIIPLSHLLLNIVNDTIKSQSSLSLLGIAMRSTASLNVI